MTVSCYYYRMQHADGRYLPVADRVFRMFDAAGKPRVRVGMMVAVNRPLCTYVKGGQTVVTRPRLQPAEVSALPSSLALIDTQRHFV